MIGLLGNGGCRAAASFSWSAKYDLSCGLEFRVGLSEGSCQGKGA